MIVGVRAARDQPDVGDLARHARSGGSRGVVVELYRAPRGGGTRPGTELPGGEGDAGGRKAVHFGGVVVVLNGQGVLGATGNGQSAARGGEIQDQRFGGFVHKIGVELKSEGLLGGGVGGEDEAVRTHGVISGGGGAVRSVDAQRDGGRRGRCLADAELHLDVGGAAGAAFDGFAHFIRQRDVGCRGEVGDARFQFLPAGADVHHGEGARLLIAGEDVHAVVVGVVHVVTHHVGGGWRQGIVVAVAGFIERAAVVGVVAVGRVGAEIIGRTGTARCAAAQTAGGQAVAPDVAQPDPVSDFVGGGASQVVGRIEDEGAVVQVAGSEALEAHHHTVGVGSLRAGGHSLESAGFGELRVAEQIVVRRGEFDAPHVEVLIRVPDGVRLDRSLDVVAGRSVLVDVHMVHPRGGVAVGVGLGHAKFDFEVGTHGFVIEAARSGFAPKILVQYGDLGNGLRVGDVRRGPDGFAVVQHVNHHRNDDDVPVARAAGEFLLFLFHLWGEPLLELLDAGQAGVLRPSPGIDFHGGAFADARRSHFGAIVVDVGIRGMWMVGGGDLRNAEVGED